MSTAAINSMNTPALLIRAINLTPSALISVVKAISTVPRMTALVAKSYSPLPSPMIWKPLHIRGRLSWYASTTAEIVTIDAVSISQPDDQPTSRLPSSWTSCRPTPRRDTWRPAP